MKKKLFAVLFIISCICLVVSVCALIFLLRDSDFDKVKESISSNHTEQTGTSAETEDTADETESEAPLIDNPVDFAAWQAENPDIYAWIVVPGTPIDYPVLQRAEDELYYLRRDYKGNYYYPGCIFTQLLNSKEFSDPNTLIYGHNTFDGTFFGPLHEFQNKSFFDENDTIYIYTPGHKLTYRIFAAYEYDSRHILKSFDFTDKAVFSAYIKTCLDPTSDIRQVREGVEITDEDKIVTLSTCMPSGSESVRYLVQGVLIKDERTK